MKKNKMVIVATVLVVLGIIANFLPASLVEGHMDLYGLAFIILGFGAGITGIIGRKQAKKANEGGVKLALFPIIAGFLIGGFGILSLLSGMLLKSDVMQNPEFTASFCTQEFTTDCVDNGDGTASCKYQNSYDVKCKKENLRDSQYK